MGEPVGGETRPARIANGRPKTAKPKRAPARSRILLITRFKSDTAVVDAIGSDGPLIQMHPPILFVERLPNHLLSKLTFDQLLTSASKFVGRGFVAEKPL